MGAHCTWRNVNEFSQAPPSACSGHTPSTAGHTPPIAGHTPSTADHTPFYHWPHPFHRWPHPFHRWPHLFHCWPHPFTAGHTPSTAGHTLSPLATPPPLAGLRPLAGEGACGATVLVAQPRPLLRVLRVTPEPWSRTGREPLWGPPAALSSSAAHFAQPVGAGSPRVAPVRLRRCLARLPGAANQRGGLLPVPPSRSAEPRLGGPLG